MITHLFSLTASNVVTLTVSYYVSINCTSTAITYSHSLPHIIMYLSIIHQMYLLTLTVLHLSIYYTTAITYSQRLPHTSNHPSINCNNYIVLGNCFTSFHLQPKYFAVATMQLRSYFSNLQFLYNFVLQFRLV